MNLQEIREYEDKNLIITTTNNITYITISPLNISSKKLKREENIKLIRCFKCSAYINPYCELLRNSFKCSICLSINFIDLQLNIKKEKSNKIFNLKKNKEENKEINKPELINTIIETNADDKFIFKKPTKNLITFILDIKNINILPYIIKNLKKETNDNYLNNKKYCFIIYNKTTIYFLKKLNNSLLIIKDFINPPLIQKSQIYFNIKEINLINYKEIINKIKKRNEENNIFVLLTIICKYLINSSIFCFPFNDSIFFKNKIQDILEDNNSSISFILSTNNLFTKCINYLSEFSYKTGGTLILYNYNNELDIINTIKKLINDIKQIVSNIFLRIRCSSSFLLYDTFFKRIDKQNNLICINNLKINEFLDFSIKLNTNLNNQFNEDSCIQIAILYDYNLEKKLRIINLLISHKIPSLSNKLKGNEIFHIGLFYFLKKYTKFINSITNKENNENKIIEFQNEFPKNLELLYLMKCINKNLLFKPTNLLFKYFYFHKIISEGLYFKSRLIYPILIFNNEIQIPSIFDFNNEFILICADKLFIKINSIELLEDKIIEILDEFQLNDIKVIVNENIDYEVIKSYLIS